MRKWITQLLTRLGIWARKRSYAEAIQMAGDIRKRTGQKVLVFFVGGEFRPVTKQRIRSMKRLGYFKGLDYATIEKRALYVAG